VVVDVFARRPLRDSLKRTLKRFRRELEAGDPFEASISAT
jgi:DNA-binding protein Fis